MPFTLHAKVPFTYNLGHLLIVEHYVGELTSAHYGQISPIGPSLHGKLDNVGGLWYNVDMVVEKPPQLIDNLG